MNWQSKDTAPTDGTPIICNHTDGSGVFVARAGVYDDNLSKFGWFDLDYSDEASNFTEWLPHPDHLSPKEGQADG